MTSENPLGKVLDLTNSVDLGMNIRLEDMVAIASSKHEIELKKMAAALSKQHAEINTETRKINSRLSAFEDAYAESLLKSPKSEFLTAAARLDLDIDIEVKHTGIEIKEQIEESSGNRYLFKYSIRFTGRHAPPSSWRDDSPGSKFERDITTCTSGTGFQMVELCKESASLRDRAVEVQNKLSSVRKALREVDSLERQARAQLAEATLESAGDVGKEILDRLKGMDTSHLLEDSD